MSSILIGSTNLKGPVGIRPGLLIFRPSNGYTLLVTVAGMRKVIRLCLFLLALTMSADAAMAEERGDVGYPNVATALQDLRSRPDVESNVQNNWTIFADPKAKMVWLFAQPGHPAYPAVVRRQPIETNRGIVLETKILCEAPQQACDDLVRQFQQMQPHK